MKLSQRIYDICDAISIGETIADIGTDHGYVPMLAIKNNISPYAIMSDISEDSLSKAVSTFKYANIPCKDSQFRVGDGLEPINSNEVDDLIIAGLGGYTIIDILDKDINKSKSFKKLILQPRKFAGDLRYYLYTHGWDIIAEKLSPEGKFICEIIIAVPTGLTCRKELYPKGDIRWNYPETFKSVQYDLLKKRLDWKFSSLDNEINNLLKSNSDTSTVISSLKSDKEYLRNLLDLCKKNE